MLKMLRDMLTDVGAKKLMNEGRDAAPSGRAHLQHTTVAGEAVAHQSRR
jgi:hypothetical protein